MLPSDGCRQSWTGGVVESELGFQLRGSRFKSPTSLIQTLLFSFHKYTTVHCSSFKYLPDDISNGYPIPDEKLTIGYSIPDEIPTTCFQLCELV